MTLRLPAHKCGLYLEHNVHRDYYMPVAQWILEELEDRGADQSVWVSPEERDRAIAHDEVWTLQWYPNTPVGFYQLAASSLDVLLTAAIEVEKTAK